MAIRIIVSDAAQVVVQAYGEDGWAAQSLLLQASEPQTRRARNGKGAGAQAASPAVAEPPAAVASDDAPVPIAVDDAKLPEPPAEIVMPPELLAEASDVTATVPPTQPEPVTDTEQAEQAEEN
jgi:hypothetical protein